MASVADEIGSVSFVLALGDNFYRYTFIHLRPAYPPPQNQFPIAHVIPDSLGAEFPALTIRGSRPPSRTSTPTRRSKCRGISSQVRNPFSGQWPEHSCVVYDEQQKTFVLPNWNNVEFNL
jgi:hypothetical protein